MEKFCWKGHASMLEANTMWGLMSPLSKLLMASGAVTSLVVTDLRIGGAMVLFCLEAARTSRPLRLPAIRQYGAIC